MTHRSPLIVFLLTFVTFGLYFLYWMWVTAGELDRRGGNVPHPIWSLVPILNFWFLWRWCKGVAVATDGDWSTGVALLLMLLLPGIGAAVLQSTFNRYATEGVPVPA